MRNKITFNEFISQFKTSIIITTIDIKKVFPNLSPDSTHLWNKKKYLSRIGKGIYFNSYFFKEKINEQMSFLIANNAYSPSYVSLQSALNYYGLIPEAVKNITSVTSRKTNTTEYNFGQFLYKSIKPSLMFDYELIQKDGFYYKIATPEKAFVDFLYLNPNLKTFDDFSELRVNSEYFDEIINRKRLISLVEKIGSKSLKTRVLKLMKFIDYDKST